MYLTESELSCGVQMLTDVGTDPTFEEYKDAMAEGNIENSHDGLGCFIIASVPWNWKNSVKFLKSIGFKAHGVRMNPNSGNKITLLSKTLTDKERKSLVGSRCRDCDEPIPGKRRVCDSCKEDRRRWRY